MSTIFSMSITNQINTFIKSLNINLSKSGKLEYTDMEYTPSTLYDGISPDIWNSSGIEATFFLSPLSSRKLTFKNATAKYLSNLKRERREDLLGDGEPLPEWADTNWLDCQPIMELTSAKLHILEISTQTLTDMSYEVFKLCAPKDIREMRPIMPCESLYAPLDLRKSWMSEYMKNKTLLINRHIAPDWRYSTREGQAKCPELLKRFLLHLFPNKQCRDFMLNWVRNAIIAERNGTYLVLNAPKGIGKNLFVGLVQGLIGTNNFSKANRGFLDKEFNSMLGDKRLILIDEQAANTAHKIDVLKDYVNAEQNIEAKGVDANNTIMTFNSFIICNNRDTDLKLESDDRRFSVMDLTTIPLKEKFTLDEMVFIDSIKEQPEMIESFGRWLLEECEAPHIDTQTPFKGERFRHLVKSSLWEWQKFVVDKVISREEESYSVKSLVMEYKQNRTSNKSSISKDKLHDFLRDYKHEGKELGAISRVDGEWELIPSKHYLKLDDEELNIIENIL